MTPARPHPLLAVAGPTGSGKSHLALELALRFHGEIVNCDSLQIYRHLEIGTAKTPPAERRGIPHHLFDIREPHEIFSAGDYAAAARPVLADIAARGRLPIVTGGTGFYLRALRDGLTEGPRRDDALRARLSTRETRRPGSLHTLLSRFDPLTAARIHFRDVNKLIRALEICLLARQPASSLFLSGAQPLEGFQTLLLVLDPPRAELHSRIAARTRAMYEQGLLAELQTLLDAGLDPGAKALESIGYKEALAVLQGRLTLPEAIELTTIATRQYAKRQLTWFRREHGAIPLAGFGDSPSILASAARLTAELLR